MPRQTPRLATWTLVSAAIVLFCSPLTSAQNAHDSRIVFLHPGAASLNADAKAVLDLTTPTEQEQWDNIRDFLLTIEEGVDMSRPIRVDVLTGFTPVRYFIWVPYEPNELQALRDNMDNFGYETIRDRGNRSLYQIDGEIQGWMLVQGLYAVIVETTPSDKMILKGMLEKLGKPEDGIEALVERAASLGVLLGNSAQDEASQAKRREDFKEVRQNLLDALERRPSERATEFALRELVLKTQLDEFERLLAEADEITFFGDLDRDAGTATGNSKTTAIEGSSLAESIALFGSRPDRFASIPRPADAILTGRMNHPIDPMRQGNAKAILDAGVAAAKDRAANAESLTDDRKAASAALAEEVGKVLNVVVTDGYVNGFLDVVPDGDGGYNALAGITSPDGNVMIPAMEKLKEVGGENVVEIGVGTVGDVTLHHMVLEPGYIDFMDDMFGEKTDYWVGTSQDIVWMASGKGAREKLEALIPTLGESADSNIALDATIKMLPWAERVDEIESAKPEPTDRTGRTKYREDARRRARVIEALQSEDGVSIVAKVEGDTVLIDMNFEKGLLRLAGKLFSAFSKENFEE